MDIQNFFETLDEKGFRTYAITGGGGKTSLMFALGQYFAKRYRTLATTTTKIKRPCAGECDSLVLGPLSDLEGCADSGLVVAGTSYIGAKLIGFTPEEIDRLVSKRAFDRIIIEADGSRGLSLKAYEMWEPPVPQSTDCHFIVAGADILTSALSTSNTFRCEELCKRYAFKTGEPIPIDKLARLLSNRAEYLKNSPDSAYRILLLNKCELLPEARLCTIVNELMRCLKGYDVIVTASLASSVGAIRSPAARTTHVSST